MVGGKPTINHHPSSFFPRPCIICTSYIYRQMHVTRNPSSFPDRAETYMESSKSSIMPSSISGAMATLVSFHAGYFRISLSLSSQALLWKTLSASHHHLLRHFAQMLPSAAFILLWTSALVSLSVLSFLYALRCFVRLPSVKAEFRHHVGVNYLFAPWISALLLLQSSPFLQPQSKAYVVLWLAFTTPVIALDVKIYGQWFTQGKRFLSMVANPTSQMSVIANMVGARAAALMGWKESAVCMFSLGIAHYLVLFVTLYQRFVGSDRLPVMLRPVFFLFFAAPSMASLAWDSISASFDSTAKMLFFLSLFLFTSLVVRPSLFRKSMRRFSVTWWAYSFPLTMLAMASIQYAQAVRAGAANVLMLALTVLSVAVSFALMLFSFVNTSGILPTNDPFYICPPPVSPVGDATATSCSCNNNGCESRV